jgi:hypothetical protein
MLQILGSEGTHIRPAAVLVDGEEGLRVRADSGDR